MTTRRALRNLGRALTAIFGSAVLLWLAACAFLLINRTEIIYPFIRTPLPTKIAGVPGADIKMLTASDGVELVVWTAPPEPGRPVILFFTGNTAGLELYLERFRAFAGAGFGFAALNYRGAGGADGVPSQTALTDDAVLVYDSLDGLLGQTIPAGLRVATGVSLGTAVATQLAVRRPHAAVTLEAPFARLCEAGAAKYPLIPVCLLLPDNRWESVAVIDEINAPLLILHGRRDQLVAFSQGEKLFGAAAEPKEMIAYPEGHHNDLASHGSVTAIIDWVERRLGSVERDQP